MKDSVTGRAEAAKAAARIPLSRVFWRVIRMMGRFTCQEHYTARWHPGISPMITSMKSTHAKCRIQTQCGES